MVNTIPGIVRPTSQDTKIVYPAVRRTDVTDTIHGVTIADPYRWLEDPDSKETEVDKSKRASSNDSGLSTDADILPSSTFAFLQMIGLCECSERDLN